jgi:hypothetical protein
MASSFRAHALHANTQPTHRFCCRPLQPHNVASSSSTYEAAALFRTHALCAHSQLTHRFCCRPLQPHNVASSSSIHKAAAWHHYSEHMHCTHIHSAPTASAAALSSLTTCGESTLAKLVPPALLLRSSMLPAPHTVSNQIDVGVEN